MHSQEKQASILFFIPARGGSKGLLKKNLRKCGGRCLIDWTLSAAKLTSYAGYIFVSTDCFEIAEHARNQGAQVPFLRPAELAGDDSKLSSAIFHAVEEFKNQGINFDLVVVLQPTSPLRNFLHIDESIELYCKNRSSNMDTLISVYQIDRKYLWMMQERGGYINFINQSINIDNPRRQELEQAFLPNGAIFILDASNIQNWVYGNRTIPYLMDAIHSIDIDSEDDLTLADSYLNKQ